MAILKCKMCGGDLNIVEGETVAVCEYCETKQTVPTADNEKKLTLFARANRLRAACEFDKAAGIYETIVADFPEEAEAYWGLLLCKFGIEYVDDPATGKKIPTCHRSSFDSIMDDSDFEQVIECADMVARRVYREEAKAIEELRKSIIEVSSKEEPYDIFICYKETDENGDRTVDSVMAQDVYNALTEKGYRVFFSRITLEDKLGQEYEPYIFAALNSAKVMLAFGTDYEYYNAVWVKNEWSRFLALIAKGEKKTLIPCYKDIDAYDLPKEFRRLQAQDMGKVGAVQDLLRGIEKIIPLKKKEEPIQQSESMQSGSKAAPLIKRGMLALEDGEWNKANEYFDQALNSDAECADAYIGLLMAELHVHYRVGLEVQQKPFDENNNFKKAVRFGDEKTKAELNGYITIINERNKNEAYDRAVNAMNAAKTETEYHSAALLFKVIPGWRDADALGAECRKKAEIARKDALYDHAVNAMNAAKNEKEYQAASSSFKSVSGWKDADALAADCLEKAEIIRKDAIYDRGVNVMNSAKTVSDYQAAAKEFKSIPHWKDADQYAKQCLEKAEVCRKDDVYSAAFVKRNTRSIEKLNQAIKEFGSISGWRDADDQIEFCKKKIEEIKSEEESHRLESEHKKEEQRIRAEEEEKERQKKRKKGIKIASIAASAVAVCAAFVIVLTTVIIPNQKYNSSVEKYGKDMVDGISALKDGDTYKFGSYEQDNNNSNGKEDIEWIVLEKNGYSCLLISKYALDCQKYNDSETEVTWETCSLRKWLNEDFINKAFTSEEQSVVSDSTVNADRNTVFSTSSGNNTTDKVFLLSIAEAEKYFSTDENGACSPTDYAKANGVFLPGDGTCCSWWLRSPGRSLTESAIVLASNRDYSNNELDDYDIEGVSVTYDTCGVRPVLRIDLE